MPQENAPPEPWQLERETVDIIPLLVEAYDPLNAEWVETTDYTVACVPNGTRPASANFAAPTVFGGQLGYVVNGPTLTASAALPANFVGYVKISATPLAPEYRAFILQLQ